MNDSKNQVPVCSPLCYEPLWIIVSLIYRFVSIRIPKPDVEDVSAEIIVKVWHGLQDIEKKNALKAWALKIAAHHIVDYYRAHQRDPAMTLEEIPKPLPQESDQTETWATLLSVGAALVTLQSPNLNVKNPWQPISWSNTWQATQDAVLKTISSSWNVFNYLVVGIGYAFPYLIISALGWIVYRVWKKRENR